jgi:hypothetical protein
MCGRNKLTGLRPYSELSGPTKQGLTPAASRYRALLELTTLALVPNSSATSGRADAIIVELIGGKKAPKEARAVIMALRFVLNLAY